MPYSPTIFISIGKNNFFSVSKKDANHSLSKENFSAFSPQNFATCAVRFYNYTTKLGAQIQ
jgi:hypothetical protein